MPKRKNSKSSNKTIFIIAVIIFILLVALIVILYTTGTFNKILVEMQTDANAPSYEQQNQGETTTPTGTRTRNTETQTKTLRGASEGTIDGDEQVKIHFVDIGQGDAIVLDLPNGEYMVIDAGSGASANATTATQTKYYSYLDEVVDGDVINYMVVSHEDSDHVNMMKKVLDKYEVKNIYYNYLDDTTKATATSTYAKFLQAAENETGAQLYPINSEESVTFTFSVGDCDFTIFSPGNDGFTTKDARIKNGMSIIVLMQYAGRKILFTGDATCKTKQNAADEEEEWFISYTSDYDMDIDFLKVAHHGSESSSSADFLEYVKAEYGIISVGTGNTYGHPTEAALNRLADADVTVYRTDLDGTIVLTIDDDGDFVFEFIQPEEGSTDNG